MAAMLWRHIVIKFDNDPGLFNIVRLSEQSFLEAKMYL